MCGHVDRTRRPLVFEPGLRGTYMQHAYDFYKPDLTSEYPIVDGQFSIRCYTQAVDECYRAYNKRASKAHASTQTNGLAVNGSHSTVNSEDDDTAQKTPFDSLDHVVFHSPTCKLVSKSYGRLLYNDFLADPAHPAFAEVPAELRNLEYEASLTDRTVEKLFMALTKKRFAERVQPSIEVPTMCGNMYCASVYGGLVSLLSNVDSTNLMGKRIGVFSYGSGLASSFFSLKVIGDVGPMQEKVDLHQRLQARRTVPPEVYDEVCSFPPLLMHTPLGSRSIRRARR